jgi:hypothetical protein
VRLRSGGSQFQVRLDKNLYEVLSLQKKLSMVVHICHPRYGEEHKIGGSQFRTEGQEVRTYVKNNQRRKELEAWFKQESTA